MRKRLLPGVAVLTVVLSAATPAHAVRFQDKSQVANEQAAASARVGCGTRMPDLDRRSYGRLFDANGVNIRTGPSTSCAILGRAYSSQRVDYHCWAVGQKVNGYDTWTYLRNVSTGKYGWVNDSLLDLNPNGTRGSLVYCG